jgi:hypothetical protein
MRRRALTMALSSLAALALAGCQTTGGGCPALVKYSAATQKRAAAEIRAGHAPTLGRFVVDYGKLRDACRVGR